MEDKLSESERGREGAEQRAKELAEKNSRICSELEEISELVKQMEREREIAEKKLKENIVLLQVSLYNYSKSPFPSTRESIKTHNLSFFIPPQISYMTIIYESYIYCQEEKATLSTSLERFQSELHKVESEKRELLADNQRMAELLAVSEGDSQEASQVMERLNEERRSLQRQCKQLRDNGET